MGWSSGSTLAAEIWDAIEEVMPPDVDPAKVKRLARELVDLFEDMDCDTLDEIDGPIGWESHTMRLERQGAPESPALGESFKDRWGDRWTFDGSRWVEERP